YIYTDGSFDLQITVSFIITFALSLLVTYLESYINFIIVNRSSAGHIPAAEIFMSGSFMAVGCVVMFVLVLLATSGIGWLQTILKGAGSVVAAVLRIIFSMIGTDESSDFVDDTHVEGGMASDIIYDSEPALIWEILTVISVIFIAAAFIYLLFRTFKWLYLFIRERMQYKVPVGDDNSFEAVMEVREKYKAVEKSSGKNRNFLKNLFRNFSANEKIRRLYKKHVLKYSNDLQGGRLKEADLNRPEFITAGEWGRALGKPVISEIYDRARYSDTECTTDDYKLMKQVINNHSPQINAD
ncbi:MAG: DUF4129 domain-containing protein, partial [Lachnospiraceae bacterium]|nr:DUF4129 domain-containing protein [Lachnospiraceae bacterium]